MSRLIIYLILFSYCQVASGSDSLFCRSAYPNKGKQIFVSTLTGTIAAGSLTGLASIWYKDDLSRFTFFDDSDEWKQMDKAGHLATTYNASLIISDLYRWSGTDDKKSRLLGSSASLFYMTAVEVMDGFSKGYGFSVSDMTFNAAGSVAAYFKTDKTQRYFPLIKYSFHKTSFPDVNPNLLGTSFHEQMIKDYNGQTYWISFPGLIENAQWACVSLGYGATNMVNARDAQNLSRGYKPVRQYYLSLDADMSRIKFRSCFLRGFFSVFRFVKVPFPAMELSGGNVGFRLFYF